MKKIKKILLVSNKNPFEYTGGVEIVCKNLATRLNQNFKITVIYQNQTEEKFQNEVAKNIQLLGIKTEQKLILGDVDFSKKINQELHKNHYDFLIDNGALSFKIEKKDLKTKIISIAHGTNAGNYQARKINNFTDFLAQKYRGLWVFWQKNFYNKKCDKIVAISEKIEQEILQYYKTEKEKLEIINNGVSFRLDEEKLKFKADKKFEKKVAFVSTDHVWKGVKILEEVAEKLPDYTFYIYGKNYVTKLKNIKYMGMVSNDKISLEMLDKDIFFLPSKYEGQSLAMLDAMACGQIILTSKKADPALKSVSDSVFISEENTAKDYINYLQKIEEKPDFYKEKAFENIKKINEINWDNQAKKYLDLLTNLEN